MSVLVARVYNKSKKYTIGDIIVDDLVRTKISEAMSTIDVLKGNGYMPCIPSHILIILQQLEYSTDGNNQERSNYG